MLPTTAPVVEITLGGKPRHLYFSFRAWHSLGVNPLKPSDVMLFLQGDENTEGLTAEKAARWVHAGILGYQSLMRRLAQEDGIAPPPVCDESWDFDRVLDLLDTEAFAQIMGALNAASEARGSKSPEAEPQPGNA